MPTDCLYPVSTGDIGKIASRFRCIAKTQATKNARGHDSRRTDFVLCAHARCERVGTGLVEDYSRDVGIEELLAHGWWVDNGCFGVSKGIRQRHLRKELQDLWMSLHQGAIALIQRTYVEPGNDGPYPALHLLSRDLGEALKRFGFSRAFVGGVALIISILTRPNEPFFVTLGPNTNWSNVYPCIQERHTLQSLLSVGLSRHDSPP